jgi:hypothetical protein
METFETIFSTLKLHKEQGRNFFYMEVSPLQSQSSNRRKVSQREMMWKILSPFEKGLPFLADKDKWKI